jgi:hypothetical protein
LLIVVLGMMTVMLILVTGILPSVAQELKRERETEMLFRGKQIVEAVARYQVLSRQRVGQGRGPQPGIGGFQGFGPWPDSLEQLADGVTLPPNRRVRLLRRSALLDPANQNKPWELVDRGHPALRDFLEAYYETVGQRMPPQIRLVYLGSTVDFGDEEEPRGRGTREPGSQGARGLGRSPAFGLGQLGQDQEGERPQFIFGVVSGSQEKAMRDFYGLERYDQWAFVFVPGLPEVTGDQRIDMLARQIVFPSDPLSLRTSGMGGGMMTFGQRPPVGPGGPGSGAGGPGGPPSGQKPGGPSR